jgi:L-lactate dehydrogenase complex protein LldG
VIRDLEFKHQTSRITHHASRITHHYEVSMSIARDEVLHRIQAALRDVPASEHPEQVLVERTYQRTSTTTRAELVEHFTERVAEYRAAVRHVAPADVHGAISAACAVHGIRRLVVPNDLPDEWAPAGVELLRDTGLTIAQLDESDGVLTGCALGVAQTGTIVLDCGPLQGRRVITLLPDYHLCIVRADQIVDLIPEAMTQLDRAVRAERRPLTFISGPSATSDIELNRVEGVHGPRTLEVLVVMSDE